jgi:hypothetical protein
MGVNHSVNARLPGTFLPDALAKSRGPGGGDLMQVLQLEIWVQRRWAEGKENRS